MHWSEANLPQLFQILDSDDQLRAVKRVLKSLELDDKVWTPKKVQNFINSRKDEGLRAADIVAEGGNAWLAKMLEIYHAYEEMCQRTGIVDFAELLLRVYELLRDNSLLLEHYRQRFQHLLVDEFQDTNTIQYQWLRLLAGSQGKLFVVFDDDQSVYSFRGARIENIQNLRRDFSDTCLIRLEQNYRSTGTILGAANALIANNQSRLGKKLWTQDKAGEPVFLYAAYTETDEAQFVVDKIKTWYGKRNQVAILYRTTAQSRVFEETLLQKGIPYRIYGSLRFYERLEIKDMLAYLRLQLHRDDDGAFERVVNTPKRGIGGRTVEVLRSVARQQGVSLWKAAQIVIETKQLKARASQSLTAFLKLIEQLAEQVKGLPLHEQVEVVKITSGLVAHYWKEHKEEAQRRLENIEELVNAARQFETRGFQEFRRFQELGNEAVVSPPEGSMPVRTELGIDTVTGYLSDFLDYAVLEAGEGQGAPSEESVQLMTLHAAKGLEFDVVFLCGLEEGLFPHQNSFGELEEERRLCYVGITRARQYLYLCHSESRYRYGRRELGKPSRFLDEIPDELIQEVRLPSPILPFRLSGTKQVDNWQIGQRVKHHKFGEGIVIDCDGEGAYARIHVKFATENKWLMLAYTRLEKVS